MGKRALLVEIHNQLPSNETDLFAIAVFTYTLTFFKDNFNLTYGNIIFLYVKSFTSYDFYLLQIFISNMDITSKMNLQKWALIAYDTL